jgi:transcriptional repressor NrdR
MQCTVCQYPYTSVVETRHDDDDSIRRRRECLRCGMRFTTKEMLREARKLKKMEIK